MLGLGNSLSNAIVPTAISPIETMIADFQSRVTTDSGTNEGTVCLTTLLTALNDIE